MSGQLGTAADATQVSPAKLGDQGMTYAYCSGVSTWKTGMRIAAWPKDEVRSPVV